jgi:hypothetical protein
MHRIRPVFISARRLHMARLESQTKLGYFPTPDITLSLLPTWLTVPTDSQMRRYLDPCCGKGEALAYLANGYAETFGIGPTPIDGG